MIRHNEELNISHILQYINVQLQVTFKADKDKVSISKWLFEHIRISNYNYLRPW